ncbi:MAG: type II toxin-antitoxin system HicB family antitoxin [Pseudomonadota bacterium]
MKTYIALLRKEECSSYGVDFPDFPGCITGGETMDVAYREAREALQLHIKGMLEDREDIPEPSSLDKILADPENEGAVPFPVQIPGQKTRRVDITIPEDILKEIDTYARKHSMSRSAFLTSAALRVTRAD